MNEAWRKGLHERAQLVQERTSGRKKLWPGIGLRPQDVDYVLITPLQAYATGNIALFSRMPWFLPVEARMDRGFPCPQVRYAYSQEAANSGRFALLPGDSGAGEIAFTRG